MMKLPPELCWAAKPLLPVRFDAAPLQVGMNGNVWHTAVASMLLCRARRQQAEPVLRTLLERWPTHECLARSETAELEDVVRPCGLQRNRARQLQRMSVSYSAEWWDDLRELPGVGLYVADAVGLFCFGCTELESGDAVLQTFKPSFRVAYVGGMWTVFGPEGELPGVAEPYPHNAVNCRRMLECVPCSPRLTSSATPPSTTPG